MAPKGGKEDRVQAILALAEELNDTLASSDAIKTSQIHELRNEVQRLALVNVATATDRKLDLDKQGTRLWNQALQIRQQGQDSETRCLSKSKLLTVCMPMLTEIVRVFGYLIIDLAQRCSLSHTLSNDVRVFKTSLKTSKFCLEQHQLGLAEIIIERAAIYNERLKAHDDGSREQYQTMVCRLLTDYIHLRTAIAWRQDRLDLAKLMLAQAKLDPGDLEPASAEELADTFFEIGRSESRKSQWSEARYWLEKAYDTLSGQAVEKLSTDAEELQLGIMHAMARTLIHFEDDDSRTKAWDIAKGLSFGYGDRLIVLLLKLDVMAVNPAYAAQDYCDIVLNITRTIHLTDTNIKTVLHHVHQLRVRSSLLAHTILGTLLRERLLGAEQPKWLEKVFVTTIWNCTSTEDFTDALGSLRELLDFLLSHSIHSLSPTATHAAQILIWKLIESTYNQHLFKASSEWCQLSLHNVFSNSGEFNAGKLQRKLMLCALAISDAEKAREIYHRMSDSNRTEPSTQYILYKVALRLHDLGLATECLDAICNASAKDATLLYACVLEAQQTGDQIQMVTSLQRVLEKYGYSAPGDVHLPALLRCAARLLMREVEDPQCRIENGNEEICKLFEGAANQAKRLKPESADNPFSTGELDWFSRNTYNLSLKVCTFWPPEHSLRLTQSCIKFMDLYPESLDPTTRSDLCLRRLFCDFLSVSLLIVLARNEDRTEDQHYLNVRKATMDFRVNLEEQMTRLEGGAKDDLRRKYASLIAFEYEAAARLKSWQSLDSLIKESESLLDPTLFGIMADITLSSGAPSDVVIASLQQIINVACQNDNHDINKLSRWIRCLFSLTLTSPVEVTERLIDQVVSITEEARNHSIVYPPEELEWIVTTTFNRAIDFYCSSQDALCRRWAEKAFVLSDLCADSGRLHELLQQKFQGLTWHA